MKSESKDLQTPQTPPSQSDDMNNATLSILSDDTSSSRSLDDTQTSSLEIPADLESRFQSLLNRFNEQQEKQNRINAETKNDITFLKNTLTSLDNKINHQLSRILDKLGLTKAE